MWPVDSLQAQCNSHTNGPTTKPPLAMNYEGIKKSKIRVIIKTMSVLYLGKYL